VQLERRRRDTYGPPRGKRFLIFVDDLNMPARQQYGAQPPVELLRQWMDYGGWYDFRDKEHPFRAIIDVQFVAAMGPPGGGRNPLTPRFARHFSLFALADLDKTSLGRIFGTIIDFVLTPFPMGVWFWLLGNK
jgi:dynein heavy chain